MNLKLPLLMVIALAANISLAADTDPTRPLNHRPGANTGSAGKEPLTLQSVLISDQRKTAMINGRQVGEGDRVAGARIVQILPDRVTVESNGKRRELKLNTITVKRATGRVKK